jgi:hypothetical protein
MSNFKITKMEILASITIVAIMLLFGVLLSEKISESQADENDMYNKAIHIESTDIFQYGMNTNAGNAFVYGDLKAVDTVAYPEIGGEYIYVKKVEERCEKHEREVTKTDSEGKKYTETEEYYRWDTYDSESLQSEKVSFLGIVFPCAKINLPSADYINTINGGKTYSWKSGEYVKVKFVYYGVGTEFTGTIFTDLRDGTISDKTNFYNGLSIDDTINRLETNGKIGIVLFWIFWIILTGSCVFGFYYLDNTWLE